MNNPPTFDVDTSHRELLARNVPTKFNRSVEVIAKRRMEEYQSNQQEEDFRFGEVARYLHPNPSFRNIQVLTERLNQILNVYLTMKQSVDQVIDPKSASRELDSLEAKLNTVEVRLRSEARDHLLIERLGIEHIGDLGIGAKAFNKAGQIDEKIAIAHQSIQHMLKDIGFFNSYFRYKTNQISGRGRRKNDYSVHYLVFALADLFREVGKIDGAIMVSFNDSNEATSDFWRLVKTFCDQLDSSLEREFRDKNGKPKNFPEFIKTLCLRYQKTDYSTTRFTAHPDTQLLLDFMSIVHQTKSRK